MKNKELLRKYQNCLVVKPSNIKGAGLGVFATEFIPTGKKLGWYRGRRLSRNEWMNVENDQYAWMLHKKGEEEYIDGLKVKHNNKLRFVNGAMTDTQRKKINTAAFQQDNDIWYRATKDILPGEELLVDYGPSYVVKKHKYVHD